jgi:hypothetical protein
LLFGVLPSLCDSIPITRTWPFRPEDEKIQAALACHANSSPEHTDSNYRRDSSHSTWKDHIMATDELKTEREPTKPYILYRVGANDEIIERIAEGDFVEDLFKAHRRRLNWKYAVYHHGEQIFLPRWG